MSATRYHETDDRPPPNPPRELLERWMDFDDTTDLSAAYEAYRAHASGRDEQMTGEAA